MSTFPEDTQCRTLEDRGPWSWLYWFASHAKNVQARIALTHADREIGGFLSVLPPTSGQLKLLQYLQEAGMRQSHVAAVCLLPSCMKELIPYYVFDDR